MMNPVDNINLYNSHQMGYDSLLPLSATTTADNIFRPPCNTFIADDSFPQKTAMNSDSSLTYNVHNCDSFSFLGEDLSLHLQKQQQQQLDINNIISEQIEKLKMEVVEKRKRETRKIMETIEVSVMKRVKAKENEIEKIRKLNYGLEEKVKSLCMENKTWRNLAQSNESTANALRNILEQVLTHGNGGATINHAGATVPASSCCGSTDGVKNKEKDKDGVWRRIIGCAGVKDKEGGGDNNSIGNSDSRRLCRKCGKEESCVVILPCRHLCLCTICGSNIHICPICKSFNTASVHINMS